MWLLVGTVISIILLFSSKFLRPNLVIITSVIHTSSKPLSYAQRSAITHEERFAQTLKSIRSILSYIPNPYIVLVEGSKLSEEEYRALKEEGCNKILDCSTELSEHINGKHKSPAEARMLLFALDRIEPSCFSTISKLSGRYYLTKRYSWHRYPLWKVLYQCERENRCNTRYYRIPSDYFAIYKKTLEDALRDEEFYTGRKDIEDYNIFKDFPSHSRLMQGVQKLGVEGYVAPWNMIVEDFEQS